MNEINLMSSENFTILTDKKRFQQVLINLQSNALKFTKSGGRVKITTAYVPSQNYCSLANL
jgi:signal transduction histidine kinase